MNFTRKKTRSTSQRKKKKNLKRKIGKDKNRKKHIKILITKKMVKLR
jgi:hypothetical protein